MKTKIFCDSADLKTIRKMGTNPIVNGFTTNPSLMRLSGAKNYKNYSLKLLNVCKKKPISLEVFGDNSKQMLRQAYIINSWGKNVYIKIPVVNSKGIYSGKVINILSNNGGIAYPFTAGYNSAKAGGAMLTKVISLEWAPYNINVNGIAPGFFPTEMTRRRYESPEGREAMLNAIPLKRFAPLRDIGLLSIYLASEASDWMTGQVIYLDGGESAFRA